MWVGWNFIPKRGIGAVMSVASTMVLASLAAGQRRFCIAKRPGDDPGTTLVEDLVVVVLTVLLPALRGSGANRFATIGKPYGWRS